MNATTYYTMEATFGYDATSDSDPKLSDWLDDVVVHLEKLEVDDIMVVADEEDDTFVISLLLEAYSGDLPENVVGKGMSSLRTAFHACDASTPTWPTPREAVMLYCNVKRAGASVEADVVARETAMA